MKQQRRSLRIVAAGVVMTMGLAACGSDNGSTDPSPDTTTTPPATGQTPDAPTDPATDPTGPTDPAEPGADAASGPDAPASALRSLLTAALQEHVYLAGISVVEAATNGLDSPEFNLAAGALDENSKAIAGAVDSVYPGAGDAFLPLWRNHIQFFVNYAVGQLTGDEAVADEARADLEAYRSDFGAFIAGANPNLPADAVAAALVPHANTVFAAIDAVAGDGNDPFAALRDAAAEMPGIAEVLAGGIATQFPEQFPGDVSSAGAGLRATLTAALQEHVYLAGIAVVFGARNGLDSAEFGLAADALDANSQDIAAAVDSVYTGAGDAFLPLWRTHIGFFVDYTAARATGDEAAAQQARDDLDEYRSDFGAFLAGANPNLPADAVAGALVPHIDSLFAAIDAVLGDGNDPFAALQEAAGVMPGIAEVLAGGIAAQFPDQFGG